MDIRSMCKKQNEKLKSEDPKDHYFDQEKSRLELVKMIILHEYPLSIVSHIGFRSFVSSLQPQFKIVSRNTIKSDILKVHQAMKAKMTKVMEKLDSSHDNYRYVVLRSHKERFHGYHKPLYR